MPKRVHAPESAAAAVGPYSVATEANGFVYLSGQVGLDPATGALAEGGVTAECDQVMRNIGAILGDLGLGFDDVVKTTVFIADITDYGAVNEVYGRHLGDSKPARSAFQVAALPLGARIEIEVIAAR
jgi:2-iminobutanoate/2-iminopropanoate deaminase